MVSYLGSLVQFSPAGGSAGRCRQMSLCVGGHSPCSGHTGFAPYRGVCAFPVYTAQAPCCSVRSGPCVECSSSFRVLHESADSVAPAFCAFPGLSGSGSQRLGRPLPSAAPASVFARAGRMPAACVCSQELASSCGWWRMSTIQNLRESLDRNWRPVCSVGGDVVSGAEFAPFPSPLPPTSSGDGLVCLRLALLWSFSVHLFCEQAGSVFGLVNFLSCSPTV